jgi:hypothetical protein
MVPNKYPLDMSKKNLNDYMANFGQFLKTWGLRWDDIWVPPCILGLSPTHDTLLPICVNEKVGVPDLL